MAGTFRQAEIRCAAMAPSGRMLAGRASGQRRYGTWARNVVGRSRYPVMAVPRSGPDRKRHSTRRGWISATTPAERSPSWRSRTRTTCAGWRGTHPGCAIGPRSPGCSTQPSRTRVIGSADRFRLRNAEPGGAAPNPWQVVVVGQMEHGVLEPSVLIGGGTDDAPRRRGWVLRSAHAADCWLGP